jgi:hypothetical protein
MSALHLCRSWSLFVTIADLIHLFGCIATNYLTNEALNGHLTDVTAHDTANYSCVVNGPHNIILGAVTHQLQIRG